LEDMTERRIYEELEKEDVCEIEIKGVNNMKLKKVSPFVQKILSILLSRGVIREDFLSKIENIR
ncbi:MAG: hypothetical protein AB1397_03210, partial [bacterium]